MSMPDAGSLKSPAGGQEVECHRLLSDLPAFAYPSTTLRSTTSGHSTGTNSTTVCESPGARDRTSFACSSSCVSSACSATASDDDEDERALERCLRGTTDDLGESGLRYSLKGPPPELYSAKKDFISKGPLLGRQVGPKSELYISINIFGGLVRRIEFRGLIEFADRDFNDFSFICVCIRLCLSLFFSTLSKSAGQAKTKFKLIYCIDSTSMCRVLSFLL